MSGARERPHQDNFCTQHWLQGEAHGSRGMHSPSQNVLSPLIRQLPSWAFRGLTQGRESWRAEDCPATNGLHVPGKDWISLGFHFPLLGRSNLDQFSFYILLNAFKNLDLNLNFNSKSELWE